MKFIWNYVKPYFKGMCLGFGIKFIGTIMDLYIPGILAYIIDEIIPLKDVRLILFWGGIMVVCAVLALATNVLANRMASKVAMNAARNLRFDLFKKIMYLSCKQVDETSIPSLVSRLTSDAYNIHQFIGMIQRMGVRAPILLIGGIFMTLTMEPLLACVLIAMLPFMGYLIFKISRSGIPMYAEARVTADSVVRTVRENVTGVRIIKALSKGEYEKGRFDTVNKNHVAKETRAAKAMATTNPMMNLFLNVGMTIVILVGAFLVNKGYSQAGKIIAFMSYFTIILNSMMSVTRIFVMTSRASASATRIEDVVTLPEDLRLEKPDDFKESPYHVEFDHVTFSYHKKTDNLRDVSFALKKGETLGIIGGTGCGKTTVVNLLMRLYDTDSGTVRINGHNVKSIDPTELHQKFGVVFQNDVIFADSLKENIVFGRTLRDDDVECSSEYAQAKEFISSLPERYDHKLTIRGSNLSGGQKQRVLISRALAGNPEILILDDSSSALDYKTDAQLRTQLKEHFSDTTSIIVAQRISSIMNAEHILVLENGEVLGYGTHEQLMESCESYREISESQMGDKEKAGAKNG